MFAGRRRGVVTVLLVLLLAASGMPAAKAMLGVGGSVSLPKAPKGGEKLVFGDFAPAFPGDLVVKQPDGRSFKGQLTNAEVGGDVELDGYTVMKRADGWWVYALRRDGGTLVPSNARAGRDPVPAGVAPGVGRHRSIWEGTNGTDVRLEMFRQLQLASWEAQAAAAEEGGPRVFRFPVLMLATWWDEEAGQTQPQFQEGNTAEKFKAMLDGFGGNPKGTLTEFYFENSFGQFVVQVDVLGPFTSNRSRQDRCYYGGSDLTPPADGDLDPTDSVLGIGGLGSVGMALEAVPQADPLVDFSQYDNDGDGEVDFTALLHSGPDMAATGDPCHTWSHALPVSAFSEVAEANLGIPRGTIDAGIPTSDGVLVDRTFTMPEVDLEIGVAVHEMAHALGEPDYYNPSYSSMGTGDWDIMAGGSWFGNPPGSNPTGFQPASKVFQGWMTPRIVHSDERNVTLKPRELLPAPGYQADQTNPNVVLVPTEWIDVGDTDQYDHTWTEEDVYGLVKDGDRGYVVEGYYLENWNRVINGPSIHEEMTRAPYFDRQALSSGLMVWHFDYVRRSQVYTGANNAGSDPNRPQMDPVEWDWNDNTQELQLGNTRGEPSDLLWGAATGITSGTRQVPPGTPPPGAQPQEDETYSGTLPPGGTVDHPFTVEDNPANYALTVTVTGGGDCTLTVIGPDGNAIGGTADSGGAGDTESITVTEPAPGEYQARVGDFLACGAYEGAIDFTGVGDFFNTKGAGDTWSNWSEAPTGWAFTNVGPGSFEGLAHSAESTGSPDITLDVVNVGDGEVDASPGFVKGPGNAAGGNNGAAAGTANRMTVPVFNNGGDAVTVPVEVRAGSASGTVLRSGTVTLPPYSRKNFAFSWTPGAEGPSDLFTIVDPGGTVAEQIESNNVQKTTVWVGPNGGRVLIVDDDGGADSEKLYAGALATLGIPYSISSGHVDAATMERYEAVIWEGGLERYEGQMVDVDRAVVAAYLDGGGKLLYTSPRAAAALGEAPGSTNPFGSVAKVGFLRDYFGVTYADTQQVGGGRVTGTGDILGTTSYQTDVFPGRPLQDVWNLSEPSEKGTATPVLTWEKGEQGAGPEQSLMGARVAGSPEAGGFKTVFLGLNLRQLTRADHVAGIVSGVMKHLGVTAGGYREPVKPVVFHTSIRNRMSNTATPVMAFVVGGRSTPSATLHYRRHGQGGFWSLALTKGATKGSWHGVLPANALTPDGVDYFLRVGGAYEPRAAATGALTHTIGVALPEVATPIGIR